MNRRYFVGAKEITEAEYQEIKRKNREIMESGNLSEMKNIRYILIVEC